MVHEIYNLRIGHSEGGNTPPPCLRPYLQEVLPRHHRLRQDIRGHTGATVLPGGGTQGGGTPGERGLERSVSVHHKKNVFSKFQF